MEQTHITRKETKAIKIGSVGVGHNYPISIQSMTNTPTCKVEATLKQIRELASHGCQIIRVAVPDELAAKSLKKITAQSPLPVVADIHFDYRLALMSIANGAQALRINPGNIGALWKVKEVVIAAQERNIPIRIGVNSGSLEAALLEKWGLSARAMVESALGHVRLLEDLNYNLIKISLKATQVPLMLEAYRDIATLVSYPLHLGVTEAGLVEYGSIKSAVGIGTLLAEGIGDTIRVSLTGNPLPEIKVAKNILRALGLRKQGVEIISCPTCGRTEIDLEAIAREIEARCAQIEIPLTIAVMGCVVNGPGEAREADLGIAGGKGEGLIFAKGQIIGRVPQESLVDALWEEIEKIRQSGG